MLRRYDTKLVSFMLTTDWTSPTAIVAELMDALIGWDPVTEVTKVFSGDWSTTYKVADATSNLSAFHGAMGSAIAILKDPCFDRWQGRAADASLAYFTALEDAHAKFKPELHSLSEQYFMIANGIEGLGSLIHGLLAKVIDALIVAAIAYATGVATAPTGIGGAIGAAIGTGAAGTAVYFAVKAWEVLQEAIEMYDTFRMAVGLIASGTLAAPTFESPAVYSPA